MLFRSNKFEGTKDFSAITHGIILSGEEQRRRYVIRHLLIRPGVRLLRYKELFGSSVFQDFPLLTEWQEKGFVEVFREAFLSLTELGMGLSDYLGPMLASGEINRKMREWEEAYEPAGGSVSGQP